MAVHFLALAKIFLLSKSPLYPGIAIKRLAESILLNHHLVLFFCSDL